MKQETAVPGELKEDQNSGVPVVRFDFCSPNGTIEIRHTQPNFTNFDLKMDHNVRDACANPSVVSFLLLFFSDRAFVDCQKLYI